MCELPQCSGNLQVSPHTELVLLTQSRVSISFLSNSIWKSPPNSIFPKTLAQLLPAWGPTVPSLSFILRQKEPGGTKVMCLSRTWDGD